MNITRPRIFPLDQVQLDAASSMDLKNTNKPIPFSFISRFFQCNKKMDRNSTYGSSMDSLSTAETPLFKKKPFKKVPLAISFPTIVEGEEFSPLISLLRNPITLSTKKSISNLLSNGTLLNTPFYFNQNSDLQGTPVSYYITQKNPKGLEIILTFEADTYTPDSEGKTPLSRALDGLEESKSEQEALLHKKIILKLIKGFSYSNPSYKEIPLYHLLDDLKRCKELKVSNDINSKFITEHLKKALSAFDVFTPDLNGKTPFYKMLEDLNDCQTKNELENYVSLIEALIKEGAHLPQSKDQQDLLQIIDGITTFKFVEISFEWERLGKQVLMDISPEERKRYLDVIVNKLRDPEMSNEKKQLFNHLGRIIKNLDWVPDFNADTQNDNELNWSETY